MQYTEDPNVDTDLYIVRNPHGPGKTVIRRPRPPPTTTALDDDFDAITVEGGTTVLGPRMDDVSEEGTSVIESESEATELAGTRRETFHADQREYGGYAGKQVVDLGAQLSDIHLGIGGVPSPQAGTNTVTRDSEIVHQPRARQSLFMQEDGVGRRNSKVSNGKSGASVVSESRTGSGKRDVVTQERVPEAQPRQGRNVTSWRDEVAKSGHFEGHPPAPSAPPDTDLQTDISSIPSEKTAQAPPPDHRPVQVQMQPDIKPAPTPMPANRSKTRDVERHPSSSSSRKHAEHIRSRSAQNPSPTKAPRSERMYSAADLDVPPPPSEFTPSQFEAAHMQPMPTNPSPTKKRNDYYAPAPAPADRSYPRVNHHSSSNPAIDAILSSFQPSLTHIAPILIGLGIQTEAHLRAVGRLSEETRDREVKNVALQRGVSVVEWAMLVDRIKSM